jgi:putative endopeptidase
MPAKAAVFALFLAGGLAAQTPAPPPRSGLDLAGFDRTVRPQDDLFRFVNGGWLARTPIPGDRVTYGTFAELSDRIESDIRQIVEDTIAAPDRSRAATQIVALYTSLMDVDRIEARGIDPVRPQLAKLAAIRSVKDLAQQAGYLSATAAGGPFPGSVEDDPEQPGRLVVRIAQGGILLPDRDYYLESDARYVASREGYARYLTSLFTLAEWSVPADTARAVVALETEIASILWTQDQIRDRSLGPRTYALAALDREMPGFDWMAWAKPQGIDRVGAIVLVQPSFFSSFGALVARTPLESWKAWLRAPSRICDSNSSDAS